MIKQVVHTVVCAYEPKHIFEKVFEIDVHSANVKTTHVDTYCPFCNRKVKIKVDGQVVTEKDILKQCRMTLQHHEKP